MSSKKSKLTDFVASVFGGPVHPGLNVPAAYQDLATSNK